MSDVDALRERAKELRCLYAIDAVVAERSQTPSDAFTRVLREIPAGWQHPGDVGGCIEYLGRRFPGQGFDSNARLLSEPLLLWAVPVGRILVSDRSSTAMRANEPFLAEEAQLLRRIAARIAEFLEWKHIDLVDGTSAAKRNHWGWRERFAKLIASRIDAERFGVARLFIGGSTARGDAGPGSDIDLYAIFDGSGAQRRELVSWLEGWSLCLGEIARQQTGHEFPSGLLNVQWLEGAPDPARRPDLRELELGSRALGPGDVEGQGRVSAREP